jgi:hypothetical protein
MPDRLKEHQRFVLTEDVPEESLAAGDLGTVVMVHSGDSQGYTGEFTFLDGRTRTIVGLYEHQVRRAQSDEVARAMPAKEVSA